MVRPTIDHLFDHTARIWRPVGVKDRLGSEQRTHVLIANVGLALNRSTAPVSDIGGGLSPVGRRRMYLRPDTLALERDIIELVTGPEAPQTWEVDEPPTRPRNHHTQLDTIVWHGELPVVEES